MNRAIEFVQEHPYGTAAGVFGGGLILLLLLHRGSAATGASSSADYYGAQAAAVQSNNQLAASQMALQAHSNDLNASLAAQQQTVGAQVQIAKLEADTQQNHDTLAAQVAEQVAQLQSTTSIAISTLTTAAQTQQTQIQADTYKALSQDQVTQALAAINAEVAIANKPYDTQTQIAALAYNAGNAYNAGAAAQYGQDLRAAPTAAPNLAQNPPTPNGVYQGGGVYYNPAFGSTYDPNALHVG